MTRPAEPSGPYGPSEPPGPPGPSEPPAPSGAPSRRRRTGPSSGAPESSEAPESSGPAEQQTPPGRSNIGIWGAPQSGKTTFLAALRTAMSIGDTGWRLDGVDTRSTTFLADSTHQLAELRVFPSATQGLEPLSWRLTGMREVKEKRKKYLPAKKASVRASVYLDFVDPPGRLFDSQPAESDAKPASGGGPRFATGGPSGGSTPDRGGDLRERLVDHLAACGGLIYLFDPTREKEASDSYQFFNRTVLEISQRAPAHPRDHYLPHHLAVCITKYDHYWVRDIARKNGFESVSHPEHLFPTVHEDLAELFFEELCRADKVSNADAVRREIRQHFSPERTRYFVTSAVGFYLDPDTGRFDDDDYSNLVKRSHADGTDTMHLKGKVHPINVLEPIMWLVRSLTGPS
ncbi:hypothetical protein [Actinomadura rugatobispora]|uniref:ATP-binding protein n=1 Tax=Actinomadura rugatobispora TaxID=1994 RepID=A0ABW0ZYZ0_9ACTN